MLLLLKNKFTIMLLVGMFSFYMADAAIYFIHVPKTGGVTIASLITNESDKAKVPFYSSHATFYDIQKAVKAGKARVVTFLREPVSRVISEHRYLITKHKGNQRRAQFHGLLTQGDPIYTANNEMCKFLSGLDPKDPAISIQQHLDAALETVQQFYFIGITEKMEESINRLFSGLGWPLPEKIHPFNTSEDSEEFSSEVLEGIRERNWADMILYDQALELFEKQKERFTINTTPYSEPPSSWVDFTFNMSIRGYGWATKADGEYRPEKMRRWADENNEAAINFWLIGGQEYRLTVEAYLPPILFDSFAVSVDGTPLTLQLLAADEVDGFSHAKVAFQATIPKELIHNESATRLLFTLKEPAGKEAKQFFDDWKRKEFMHNCRRGHFACDRIEIQH